MFKFSFEHRCLKEKNKHSLRLNDPAQGVPLCEYNSSNCIIQQDPDGISVILTDLIQTKY